MALRKTNTFLPTVFQTDANKKFLTATVDQLVTEPNLETLYGYVGRKFAPTYQVGDSYVVESTRDRQDYQLEPGVVIRDEQNEVTFFADYKDLLDKIEYYGGLTSDHSRLFEQEYYSFDPKISYDKLINFSQYYWLPNGPDPVEVTTEGIDLQITYDVTRDSSNGRYIFRNNGVIDNTITLARGGMYEFIVNQPGRPVWIQSELGTAGTLRATPTISSRGVEGVTNNGIDVGTITFRVPPATAQDRFVNMNTVYNADYATPIPYSVLANKTLSQFLNDYPQYAGITGQLNGKSTIFIVTSAWNNFGENAWTNPEVVYATPNATGSLGTNVITVSSTLNVKENLIVKGAGIPDNTIVVSIDAVNLTVTLSNTLTDDVNGAVTFTTTEFDPGYNIPEEQRFGVWQVIYVNAGIKNIDGSNDPVLKLIYVQDVAIDEQVYIKYGVANANKEFYKDYDGFFKQTPLITASLDQLWIQDGNRGDIFTPIKIVEYTGWSIDVNEDILGKKNYTSPNDVEFTSGLKIQFGDDVTPVEYQNRQFYVEHVGDEDGIRLIPVDELVTPEAYNDEIAINYPGEYFPDYITINRASLDRNGWSRNNRWFHVDVITATAAYNGVQPTFIGSTGRGISQTFTITTVPNPNGSGNIYAVDGVNNPILNLVRGGVYIFDQSDDSNVNHPIAFKDATGLLYTTGVVTVGSLGQAGARTIISVANNAPNNLRYHCTVHGNIMGNTITVTGGGGIRGQRPIIQFESDLQLINDGRVAKKPIDILDISIQNAFTELQGKTYTTIFGIGIINSLGQPIYPNGLRVVFAADIDPLVKNKVYDLILVQYDADDLGKPFGPYYIELSLAEDGEIAPYSTTVVKLGRYKGSQWYYDGIDWNESQQKKYLQQAPMFDVLDSTGKSYSTFTRSTFTGTKIFGYDRATTGVADSVLSRGPVEPILNANRNPITSFYLSYKNFQAQGDIKFQNYFNTDTFSFVDDTGEIVTKNINLGYFQKIIDTDTLVPKNTWLMVPEQSKQYQLFNFIFDGSNNPFTIDIGPVESESSIPYVKVFQNRRYLQLSAWSINGEEITINAPLTVNDRIDILIYSSSISATAFYEIPENLDLNAQNIDISSLTLGQLRNHLIALAENSTIVEGDILAQSNLRDVDIKQQGGTILQHSAPVPYASLFLIDQQANFINSIRYAQLEYTKFKNKFLELSLSLPGINPNDPVGSVDTILARINFVKNKSFPWYYSDMVPYGPLKNIVGQIGSIDGFQVFDPLKTNYEITEIFNDRMLSNKAVLIYLNDQQLVKGLEYNFSLETPSVDFLISLAVGDIIKIVEYTNTDGNYIPETPSKLGLWPAFVPERFYDTTYRDPIYVIRGHDGSITPTFNDYRDEFLLELEKRIYNNIKLPNNSTYSEIYSVIPGKFRSGDYSLTEFNQILSISFLSWIGNNKLDYSTNDTFEPNDPFTWN